MVHRLSRYSPKYVDGTVVVEECSRDAHADGHQSDSVTQIREIHAVSNARLSCRQAYYACQQGQHGQIACQQHFCLVDRKKPSVTGDLGVFAALPVNRFTSVETATRLVNRTCAVNRTNEVSYSPRSSGETDENILAK